MPKIEKKEQEKINISSEMVKNCKKDISRFGFSVVNYRKFLKTVGAMTENDNVLIYKNDDFETYRQKYLKKYEYSVGDAFQLEKFKIKTCDENGKQYDTGWFAPCSFWDKILDIKTN